MKIEGVNEKQMKIIIRALDLYSRLMMGQVKELSDLWDKREPVVFEALRFLKKAVFPELSLDSYYGITSMAIPEEPKISFEMLRVMEHALSWHKHPEGGITVNFDPPMEITDEPMISVSFDEID